VGETIPKGLKVTGVPRTWLAGNLKADDGPAHRASLGGPDGRLLRLGRPDARRGRRHLPRLRRPPPSVASADPCQRPDDRPGSRSATTWSVGDDLSSSVMRGLTSPEGKV
jgi:hypothetical protein